MAVERRQFVKVSYCNFGLKSNFILMMSAVGFCHLGNGRLGKCCLGSISILKTLLLELSLYNLDLKQKRDS